jgi:deoxycytidine triphosphate deaminase
MAVLLNDTELKKLLGTVIIDGDPECIRPNSYVIRLGSQGEFINTGKDYELGGKKRKKGIRVQPGHSVGVTAFETIDFRREAVHKVYPDHDLHGIISPTTDLSREGIVAPTTQVDAGYFGTLNWTLANTSSDIRRFVFKERLFRLTIFKLEKGETPAHLYGGDYQDQTGYVRSRRQGPPVGMKDTEWEDAQVKGGPEDLLENLIKSGYPWHLLGGRLKVIDQQFKSVTEEYSNIHDAIGKLTVDVNQMRERQAEMSDTVRRVVREETDSLQNRWLIGAGSLLVGVLGLVLAVTSNDRAMSVLQDYGTVSGLGLLTGSVVALYLVGRNR